MKKLNLLAAAIVVVAIFAITACTSYNENSPNPPVAVGTKVENFRLADTSGAERSLDDLKGKNGAILVFVSAQCPTVKQYNERISQFAADFAENGINVIGINSNVSESPEWVRSHAAENYKFPVLIDKGNVLADKLGASLTPEIFYLNDKNVLVYQGAIDNSSSGEEITENYLRNAVEQSSSGKPVERKTARAVGCSIKRV
ncbi:MAG TPA: redoxin domain-containing protein [Pyrinomonadaceae bacterium]|jgi:peroxiredoxin|nr:redoxin domain-containing protein [Pyrinomonadaceae bacterium]